MSMTTPIVDFVQNYAKSGTSRLHMPGHKGQALLGFEGLDITEIRGADELYEADGIIAQSEANATRLFGTAHTYYSTEGSSQCIRAMLCLAMQAAPAGQRPVLLAARNAHKALLYAAALLDLDIQWLWPAPDVAGALCSCPVTEAQLAAALDRLAWQGRTPFGVYLTSPDYLGGMQDIAALAKVCDAHGVPLLVDASQSAGTLPLHLTELGAAFIAMPGHKGLYGPQGTGLLLCGERPARPLLLGGTGSASRDRQMPPTLPDRLEAGTHNMPGIAGLLEGLRFVRRRTPEAIACRERQLAAEAVRRLKALPGVEVFTPANGPHPTGVVSFRAAGRDCEELAEALGRRGIALRAGLHCAPLAHRTAGTLDTGTVRLSLSDFNTPAQDRKSVV